MDALTTWLGVPLLVIAVVVLVRGDLATTKPNRASRAFEVLLVATALAVIAARFVLLA